MKNDKSPGSDGCTGELLLLLFFSLTDLGTFMIRTMGSTVAKCRSHKVKRLLFVYPRKEKINN